MCNPYTIHPHLPPPTPIQHVSSHCRGQTPDHCLLTVSWSAGTARVPAPTQPLEAETLVSVFAISSHAHSHRPSQANLGPVAILSLGIWGYIWCPGPKNLQAPSCLKSYSGERGLPGVKQVFWSLSDWILYFPWLVGVGRFHPQFWLDMAFPKIVHSKQPCLSPVLQSVQKPFHPLKWPLPLLGVSQSSEMEMGHHRSLPSIRNVSLSWCCGVTVKVIVCQWSVCIGDERPDELNWAILGHRVLTTVDWIWDWLGVYPFILQAQERG